MICKVCGETLEYKYCHSCNRVRDESDNTANLIREIAEKATAATNYIGEAERVERAINEGVTLRLKELRAEVENFCPSEISASNNGPRTDGYRTCCLHVLESIDSMLTQSNPTEQK